MAKQKRGTDRQQDAANVADDKNKKRQVELGEATPVHSDPRTNQEHRRAHGPEEISKDRAGQKKKSVERRRRPASQLQMNPGGDNEERTDDDDETGVFPTRVKDPRRCVKHTDVIGNRDRGEPDANLCVMPMPTLAQQRRRERDRQEQSREGHNRSEEHTSELQSRLHLVCRLLLEKKI